MTGDNTAILRNYIADEARVFFTQHRSYVNPNNIRKVQKIIPNLQKYLETSERIDLYFYYMSGTGEIPVVSDEELPHLHDAYQRLLLFFGSSELSVSAHPLPFLFIFGYDEKGTLPDGKTVLARALRDRVALISQTRNYTSQPGQRAKKEKFLPFADHAQRILESFRHVNYSFDPFSSVSLTWWGMVFVALLNKTTRTEIVADLMSGKYDPEHHAKKLELLTRYLESVASDIEGDEIRLIGFIEALTAIRAERRLATETVSWAARLNLPFRDDEEWRVHIVIPPRGTKASAFFVPNSIRIHILPDPDEQWEISIDTETRERFNETNTKVYYNDFGISHLGSGNLINFPQWLEKIQRESGFNFDIEAASISVGRKRSAIRQVQDWLAGRQL